MIQRNIQGIWRRSELVEQVHGDGATGERKGNRSSSHFQGHLHLSPTLIGARLFLPLLPTNTNNNKKLPILVYFHGGGFCFESAFSADHHQFLNSLVSEAKIIAVSVEYRLAPEHHLQSPTKIAGLPSNGWFLFQLTFITVPLRSHG
ncbi:hypothetical protein F8388_025154 [Cannabis sativa]|uniref:Alpha/beta hydrolase fold-3 domain-containing protein n=1 Tax=Cannabis sativa TaxID=3483 RepID=A0A7J6FUP0_CANSA|nr:hypothetical protein F8388_025154 [Cannabis sativa]